MSQKSHTEWQEIRDRKLADVAARISSEWQIPSSALPSTSVSNVTSIPTTCGILTSKEIRITEAHSGRSLLAALRNRELTALEITTAFCKRAAITHQVTSCLTEPLFRPAIARAQFLDAHLARTGQPLGPLHGLPVSVKDAFNIVGYDSTCGIASLCDKPATRNAPLVQFLLDAGAIIHCKTNLPQTALAIDSVNNIYGRVLNPQNRQEWTAGGSSGGEGVLVKMRGSVFGIGTDVGGSVRIPAMCNGIVGFKPSAGRIPRGGQEAGQPAEAGKVSLESAVGVIARGWDDVDLFSDVVERAKLWELDQEIMPGEWWRNIGIHGEQKQNVTIGVIWKDGVTEPLPPIRRVMEEVLQKLRSKGISVVEIEAPRFKDCQALANKFFSAEGSNHLIDRIEETGEHLIPWLAARLKRKTPASLDKYRDLAAQRLQLQNDFLSIWKTPNGQDVDAIITPTAPHPVPPIDKWNTMSYTSSFVLLDYPAAHLPVRAVDEGDLKGEMPDQVLSPWDKVNRELWDTQKINRESYLGSPLGVQVIAPRLQEKRLFDACLCIQEAVGSTERASKL
ncbi:hypothetical protein ACLMJK_002430 [Lecanora helva]